MERWLQWDSVKTKCMKQTFLRCMERIWPIWYNHETKGTFELWHLWHEDLNVTMFMHFKAWWVVWTLAKKNYSTSLSVCKACIEDKQHIATLSNKGRGEQLSFQRLCIRTCVASWEMLYLWRIVRVLGMIWRCVHVSNIYSECDVQIFQITFDWWGWRYWKAWWASKR